MLVHLLYLQLSNTLFGTVTGFLLKEAFGAGSNKWGVGFYFAFARDTCIIGQQARNSHYNICMLGGFHMQVFCGASYINIWS